MSAQFEGAPKPPEDYSPTPSDPLPSSRPSLPPLKPPMSSPTKRLPMEVPTSLARMGMLASNGNSGGITVPLDRYRAKLEECAALHQCVATLTRSNEEYQQLLIAEKAENARLRATIARLQGECQAGHHHVDAVFGAPPSAALDTSPPTGAAATSPRRASEGSVRSRREAGNEAPATAPCAATPMKSSSLSPERASNGDRRPPDVQSPASAAAVEPAGASQQQGHNSRSSPSTTCTSRTSSCSCSRSSSRGTHDPSGKAQRYAMPLRQPSRPLCSANAGATDMTAYGRAVFEILAAPLGPWEE
ncbi:hypothetical protein ABL78_4542 [Leptomonas seymouri]|uniref:Uncharacterized protein n=1 Tax=Leptomonas seymouri TaxID=5684 RepID=A0A0N1PBH7_LEPSE|nr:hypothetical protein ABL78_4542 [Leptomonas seymouri]|eukprot:KPI86391.1 hypothetical protein ABL78_4542 [Leptomonas seymouri]